MRFGQCAQCHRRPDSGESYVPSASIRAGLVVGRPRSHHHRYRRRRRFYTRDTCGAPVKTMRKHSKQLEKRIEDQRQQRLAAMTAVAVPETATATAAAVSDRRRSSKCKNGIILKNESSPELSRPSSRKSRQYFLEPIRRWNSFHNSRERKSTAAAATAAAATSATGSTASASPASSSSSSASNLPYLQTLVNLQRESKSVCARFAQSVLPKLPRGTENVQQQPVTASVSPVATCAETAARTTTSTTTITTSTGATRPPSPLLHQTVAGCAAKKQNSSPNLLLVYDRRPQQQQGSTAGGGGGGGNSLTNSPRRSASRRPKTPPPHNHHHHKQQQLAAAIASNSSSCGGRTADGSSKIPFAIIVGDSPIVCKDTSVPRIKAIRADSMSEKSSPSYLAVDLSPHRRYSFWSVNTRVLYSTPPYVLIAASHIGPLASAKTVGDFFSSIPSRLLPCTMTLLCPRVTLNGVCEIGEKYSLFIVFILVFRRKTI